MTVEHHPEHAAPPGALDARLPSGWECLFQPDAVDRLTEIEHELSEGRSAFSVGSRMRDQGVPGDQVAVLLTQIALRRKGRIKFGDAATQMLFTQAGLEQASRAVVSRLHAERFLHAGCTRVADLGCGIGSESMAFITAGLDAHAIEIDPLTARIAEHNLALPKEPHEHGATGRIQSAAPTVRGAEHAHSEAIRGTAQVSIGDAEQASLHGADGAFLDPARRTAGHRDTRRVSNPDDYSPSLRFAFGLSDRLPTGVKLGPGFDRELIPDSAEAQWVSVDGQVVETGIWFGSLARPHARRSALVIHGNQVDELSASCDTADAEVGSLGEFLYEPDGAVIRARLIGLLAEQLDARMVSKKIAYLTADSLVRSPFVQAFRFIEQLPLSEKQLKRALAERGIGKLEIKKRGADIDPAALRVRLQLRGPHSATLFLTRVADKHVALLTERL